jgi:hypothetical protein
MGGFTKVSIRHFQLIDYLFSMTEEERGTKLREVIGRGRAQLDMLIIVIRMRCSILGPVNSHNQLSFWTVL